MRKLLYLFRIFIFQLSIFNLISCEKADLSQYINKDKADGYKISFVMECPEEQFTLTRTSADLSSLATVFNFAVYQNGEKLRSINQKTGDNDFGSVTVSLPEGTYQVLALAHSCDGNASMSDPTRITFPSNKVTDTFYYYQEITVTADHQYSSQMKRCVALLRLKVLDQIPADVTQLKCYYTGGSSTFDATTGYGCVNSKQTEYRTIASHAAQQTFDLYTIPHADNDVLSLTVTSQDAQGADYSIKTLTPLQVQMRHISVYSGSLYNGTSSGAHDATFTFTADSEWEGMEEYTF